MSGDRKGEEVWSSVAPIFSLVSHLVVEVKRTERAGHGEEIAKNLNSDEYSGKNDIFYVDLICRYLYKYGVWSYCCSSLFLTTHHATTTYNNNNKPTTTN